MSPLIAVGLIFTLLAVNGLGIFKPLGYIGSSNEQGSTKAVPFSALSYSTSPTKKTSAKPLNIGASSAIVYDVSSAQRLYEKQPDNKRAIASISKLMTALVIMDGHSPDEVVTVGDIPALGLADQKIGIAKGEKLKLIDLTKALLIHSANDAANALAIYDSGSIESFADKMNAKAKEWGLDSSTFVNPSGLDESHQLSSASNVLILATILNQNRIFSEIVKTPSTKITNQEGKAYTLTTTNKILGQGGVVGIKTGYTLDAGQCLVTLSERQGNKIITVALDSPDRFLESKNMIDWAFNNYIWQ